MSRSLVRPLALSLALVLLALACARLSPTPSADVLQTAIAQTLTALPSPTSAAVAPTETAPAPASATPETAAATPEPASACPPAASPAPLAAAPDFASYGAAVLNYLNAGASPDDLHQSLLSLGLNDEQSGAVKSADLTGDGVSEVVVVIVNTQDESVGPHPPGIVFMYSCAGGSYQLAYDSGYLKDNGGPIFTAFQDLTVDGLADLVYTVEICGASTCFDKLSVIAWNGASFADAISGDTSMAFPHITFAPGASGETDIVMYGGALGSVGAGPPRAFTNVWGWNGSAIVLLSTQLDPPQYRFHVLNDADDAALAGDSAAALSLYDRVINDDTLLGWEAVTDERAHLGGYALFRSLVEREKTGDAAGAQAAYAQLQAQYAPGAPGNEWLPVADAFETAFQSGSDVHAGCAAAVATVTATPAILDPFLNYGYGNRQYAAGDVCPY